MQRDGRGDDVAVCGSRAASSSPLPRRRQRRQTSQAVVAVAMQSTRPFRAFCCISRRRPAADAVGVPAIVADVPAIESSFPCTVLRRLERRRRSEEREGTEIERVLRMEIVFLMWFLCVRFHRGGNMTHVLPVWRKLSDVSPASVPAARLLHDRFGSGGRVGPPPVVIQAEGAVRVDTARHVRTVRHTDDVHGVGRLRNEVSREIEVDRSRVRVRRTFDRPPA